MKNNTECGYSPVIEGVRMQFIKNDTTPTNSPAHKKAKNRGIWRYTY